MLNAKFHATEAEIIVQAGRPGAVTIATNMALIISYKPNLFLEKGEAIEHKMVTNSIEKAQRKVEGRNFDARKALLEYDDVANDQRQIVYHQRNLILEADNYDEMLTAVRRDVVGDLISDFIPLGSVYEQWDVAGLEQNIESDLNLKLPIQQWLDEDKALNEEPLRERLLVAVQADYEEKMSQIGPEISRFERHIMLQVLDQHWKDHLAAMDHLRHGIHLRGYAGKNPKQEYKRESYGMFEKMLDGFNREVISFLAKVQIKLEDADELEQRRREEEKNRDMDLHRGDEIADEETKVSTGFTPVKREERKVGRNEPCPCGSGKKFKQCHGKL